MTMYQQTITSTSFTTNDPQPTLNITHDRNRLKQYGNIVYMHDNWNFELELFNPKQFNILAKISIDGKSLSDAGIVIKPGQRVYLERYIDTPNKFMFKTYEVDNSNEAKNAIALNGEVSVSFFDEIVKTPWTSGTGGYNGLFQGNGNTSTAKYPYKHATRTFTSSYPEYSQILYSSTIHPIDNNVGQCNFSSIETGRVEVGEFSSQQLTYMDAAFSSYAFAGWTLKIMPISTKPIEVNQIRNYCTNCGKRQTNANWKFCPKCGTSIK